VLFGRHARKSEENLRIALFEDIFIIIAQDQFDEVNSLVPALVQQIFCVAAITLREVRSVSIGSSEVELISRCTAARNALGSLPNEVGRAGLSEIDSQYLFWHSNDEALRKLASSYGELTNEAQRAMWQDLNRMSYFEFRQVPGGPGIVRTVQDPRELFRCHPFGNLIHRVDDLSCAAGLLILWHE